MIALDTSVVIPLLVSWHEHHDRSVQTLSGRRPILIAHVALETYSVLTRLPRGLAVAASDARRLLESRFPGDPLALDGKAHGQLMADLAKGGIVGGAVYDALVAATAVAAGLRLLSFDLRAAYTYRQIGAPVDLLD